MFPKYQLAISNVSSVASLSEGGGERSEPEGVGSESECLFTPSDADAPALFSENGHPSVSFADISPIRGVPRGGAQIRQQQLYRRHTAHPSRRGGVAPPSQNIGQKCGIINIHLLLLSNQHDGRGNPYPTVLLSHAVGILKNRTFPRRDVVIPPYDKRMKQTCAENIPLS